MSILLLLSFHWIPAFAGMTIFVCFRRDDDLRVLSPG